MARSRLLIGGELVDSDRSIDVVNPATGRRFTSVPKASIEHLERAVACALHAYPAWAASPIEDRREKLLKCADLLDAHCAELAELLTLEQGKPLAAAETEVRVSALFFRAFAAYGLHSRLVDDVDRKVLVRRRPLGVVAAIVPWNFPLLVIAFKLPPALLAGNTLIVKPAPTTPVATLRFGELVRDTLPPGVLNIITDQNDLGDALTAHPDIRKISFTGSTLTGRRIMANAASTLKRLTLELGGNDAAIVLDDVDPAIVAPAILDAAFQNSGQVCLALKRLYVHDRIYDDMCNELAVLARQAVIGEGTDPKVTYGPIQNEAQYERVKGLLECARAEGTIIAGGTLPERPGYFVPPTIVRDLPDTSRLIHEEQFGPILPVVRFSDPEDALAKVNASDYALGGSVWSGDVARAQALAARFESGTVWINSHAGMSPAVPFGGAKQSGFGVEFGEEGLAEFTQLQAIYGVAG